ncbi:MAG: ATP-binding protein [Steroidobacteraceae bacterium]
MTVSLPEPIAAKRVPPDPEGTAAFMSRIGYTLEEALSDIIDNSIDATAGVILVRFVRGADRINQILIIDDGRGMLPEELQAAMQYGVRQAHGKGDLGKYGIGLKAAAFSQCKSLSVLSRKDGQSSGRRWTSESIKDDWRLEELDPEQAKRFLNLNWKPVTLEKKGTIVILNKLDSLPSAISEFTKNLQKMILDLSIDFGLRFHKFLESGSIRIVIDSTSAIDQLPDTQIEVEPLDPFGYSSSGKSGYPANFELNIAGMSLKAAAHIWPAKSRDPNYKLGSGRVAERQGFYFYRNKRLIKAGGWHNLQGDTEPHSSLARVLIEMPPELDSVFRLSVQKNTFNVPPEFIDAVRSSKAGNTPFGDYLKAAQDVYRNAPDEEHVFHYPKSGIPAALSRRLEKLLEPDEGKHNSTPVEFEWKPLDEDKVLSYDASTKTITLNRKFRDAITGGKNSGADAPLFKALVFLSLRDVFAGDKMTKKTKDKVEVLNRVLAESLKWQD